MPLTDSIFAFEEPGGLPVKRYARGTLVDGNYVKGALTTFTIRAAVQPAVEIARVQPARDLLEREQGQQVMDVRVLHTNTKLVGEDGIDVRNPTQDPDIVVYEGSEWMVLRCEPWNFRGVGGNDRFWKAVITRRMNGAS